MNRQSEVRNAPSIDGHVIELGARHSIAIYERSGVWWVAEFRDGHVEFADAVRWLGFHAEDLRYRHIRHRAGLQVSMPLTPQMVDRIERLHREDELRQPGTLHALREVAATLKRRLMSVVRSLARKVASRTRRTPSSSG